MDLDSQHTTTNQLSKGRLFMQGALAITPLSIAVIPWGLLAGSFAMDIGLTPFEGQGLSAIVFAGAAQLAAMGMIKVGAGLGTILLTTLIITSRHLLYSVSMRNKVSRLPLRWRALLGFLLTDELFAICGHHSPKQFERWYAFGAGIWFYLCWNVATLTGILAGKYIPALDQLGLEFAIAATFIAIVIPTIVRLSMIVTVISALLLSVLFHYWALDGGLMLASLVAMALGYLTETYVEKAGDEKRGEAV
ncbi:AzlC family ABC transporter permease [uncultured Photobacterium sp.]|uniref:AzlC family ABC transporter permease n=1 Tax=uncultured Photobacterium sp. TaxID=173973 RepID=UPI0026219B75|nr:AzlC family ABC transporter permease [uncultured Photobacterium sp.]